MAERLATIRLDADYLEPLQTTKEAREVLLNIKAELDRAIEELNQLRRREIEGVIREREAADRG